MPGSKQWLFADPIDNRKYDADLEGHGSCVLSKAAGAKWGVAKGANIVMVKLPAVVFDTMILLNSLNIVLQEVLKSGRKKNVLIMSWCKTPSIP